jgi:GNAT superfamily N-acetyltransferase
MKTITFNNLVALTQRFDIHNVFEYLCNGVVIGDSGSHLFIARRVNSDEDTRNYLMLFNEIFHYETAETKQVVEDLLFTNNCRTSTYNTQWYTDIDVLQYYILYSYGRKSGKLIPIGITGLYANYDETRANISWFGILPKYQKLGLGKQLLEYTERIADAQHYKTIEVFSHYNGWENHAHDFYAKNGYEMCDIEIITDEHNKEHIEFHFDKRITRHVLAKHANNLQ